MGKRWNAIHRGKIFIGNKDLKTCSRVLETRKIQIISNTTSTILQIHTYMYIYISNVEVFVDPEFHIHCKWEFEFVKPPQKTVWHYLIKFNSHLHWDPEKSILGYICKRNSCTFTAGDLGQNFHSNTVLEKSKMPIANRAYEQTGFYEMGIPRNSQNEWSTAICNNKNET